MKAEACIEEIAVADLGERYGALRIVSPRADTAMMRSIQKYGQMSPVVCVRSADGYELIDGFKRLRAYRRLNRSLLRAETMEVSARACKAAIIQLNRSGKAITDMEEAMILQSLHREDGLMQIEIAALLGRHKSWVSRRISLIERISEDVQQDIRLGLISASVARDLAKLPRGNQRATVDVVLKHRFTTRETAELISHMVKRPRWEYQTILASPWEVVEPKQPKPVGLGARLISMQSICLSVSSGYKKSSPEERGSLTDLIDRAIGAAEEAVQTMRAER